MDIYIYIYTILYINKIKKIKIFFYFINLNFKKSISPVQLPLHEPYFDFTLIIATHTKNPVITSKTYTFTYLKQIKQTYCVY